MPELIDAITRLFESIHHALGTGWTVFLLIGGVALFLGYRYWSAKRQDRILDRLIASKDDAIERIGVENQQLRIALLRSLGADADDVGAFIANPVDKKLVTADKTKPREREGV